MNELLCLKELQLIKIYARFDELLDYSKNLKRADHKLSVNRIIESIESAFPNCKGILKRSTLHRWLQKDGLDRKSLRIADDLQDRKIYARYRKSNRLEQVQCDFKEFPRGVFIDENGAPCKVYLQICIDNFSKMILSYSVTTNQKTFVFVECLKSMIKTFGVPRALLMDNGSAYRNAIITRACDCLGIKAKYCRPYSPATKGVIERFNFTINDIENQFKHLSNITLKGAQEICRARINEYNEAVHSGLEGRSPKDVFYDDATELRFVSDDVLNFSFKKLIKRSVAKDASISHEGKKYIVDTDYVNVGQDVLLLTDGTNLEQIISDNKTKPVFLQEIKENISASTWKQITGKGESEHGFNLNDYGYVLKLLREQCKKDGFAFRIANNKKIMRHTAKFTDEEFDDHPSCLVVIDNRHDRQLIAIEQKQKSFSSTHTVAKILTATFNRYLAPYRLTLTIDAKYHENEFWKIIDTYPKGFKRAEFTFPYPNLPVISMLVSETMNQEAREFHCEPTQVLRALDSQVLDLNKDSERLQDMVSACAASGKPILLLPVSKRKVIKCNTDKTVVTEEMSLAEIDKLTSSDLFHSAFSALTDFVNRIKAKYE